PPTSRTLARIELTVLVGVVENGPADRRALLGAEIDATRIAGQRNDGTDGELRRNAIGEPCREGLHPRERTRWRDRTHLVRGTSLNIWIRDGVQPAGIRGRRRDRGPACCRVDAQCRPRNPALARTVERPIRVVVAKDP